MNVKEARAKLKELAAKDSPAEEITIGRHEICYVNGKFGIRPKTDRDHRYDDVSWSFGWRMKWILEHLLDSGEITKD